MDTDEERTLSLIRVELGLLRRFFPLRSLRLCGVFAWSVGSGKTDCRKGAESAEKKRISNRFTQMHTDEGKD
jgi:hypothetical protein